MSNLITYELTWQGIEMEITHETGKWGSTDHIEIRSINPAKARTPITETGYRSHFLPIGSLDAHGITAKELVVDWLEREAQTPKWQQYAESSRQTNLFDF